MKISYVDRLTGKIEREKVYGESALQLVYGDTFLSKLFGPFLGFFAAKIPFVSKLYGFYQRLPITRKKIVPFIRKYHVDPSEFLEPISHFKSFNDFFIRELKPKARPIVPGNTIAAIPADGRYYFYPNISKANEFIVKGKKFQLQKLLKNEALASEYSEGSMVLARLCPSDYHRFHFPVDCIPRETKNINGYLFSVNPIAIRHNINIFTENKRTLTQLQSEMFGNVLFLEIGATFVGSINQTYTAHEFHSKGAEKGYFAFGGSALVILFPKNSIQFDQDLIEATNQGLEIRCLMGQSMGVVVGS